MDKKKFQFIVHPSMTIKGNPITHGTKENEVYLKKGTYVVSHEQGEPYFFTNSSGKQFLITEKNFEAN